MDGQFPKIHALQLEADALRMCSNGQGSTWTGRRRRPRWFVDAIAPDGGNRPRPFVHGVGDHGAPLVGEPKARADVFPPVRTRFSWKSPSVREPLLMTVSMPPHRFGMAAGSFIAGVLSDVWGLTAALTVMPAFGLLTPLVFSFAVQIYEADMQRAGQSIDELTSTPMARARNALA